MGKTDRVDAALRHALDHDLTIDLTTTGRRSGRPRRIEIWLLAIEGRYFITGTPGRRDWLDNIRADGSVVVHLKQGHPADLAARATEVLDADLRRRVLTHPAAAWYRERAPLDALLATSPMIELNLV